MKVIYIMKIPMNMVFLGTYKGLSFMVPSILQSSTKRSVKPNTQENSSGLSLPN